MWKTTQICKQIRCGPEGVQPLCPVNSIYVLPIYTLSMCILCSSHSSGLWIWTSKCSYDISTSHQSQSEPNLNYLSHLFFQCSLVQVPAHSPGWASKKPELHLCMYFSFSLLVPYYSSNPINYTSCIPLASIHVPSFPLLSSLVPATSFSLPFHSVVFPLYLWMQTCRYGGLTILHHVI